MALEMYRQTQQRTLSKHKGNGVVKKSRKKIKKTITKASHCIWKHTAPNWGHLQKIKAQLWEKKIVSDI